MTTALGRAAALGGWVVVQCAAARISVAQGSSQQRVGWAGDPSALAPVAELVRQPAAAPRRPLLLTAPAPRAGLYWTLGNPAALPLELNDSYTVFRAEYTDESGAYRRPLDAASTGAVTVSGSGWRPVGARGALSGGVVVRQSSMDQMAAGVGDPYGMSPHLFSDTSGTALGETAARLDGAGGWRVGGWGLGLALGFDTWTTRTGVARVPRFQRGVRPAATAGLTRTLGPLVLGAHARWQADVQTLSLVTRGVTDRVYTIAGYTEPVPVDLGPGRGYSRRIERDAAAVGGGAALQAGGIRWIGFGEVTRLNERQSTEQNNNPSTDNWDAIGHVLGLSAEVDLAGARGHLVTGIRWTHVSGDATRAALKAEGVLYSATDDAVDAGVDVRLRWGSRWEAGTGLSITHDYDVRDDVLARVGSALRTWSAGLSLETAYDVSTRLTFGLGAGAAWSTPIGAIPNPGSMGAGYREWLAPALSYAATPALSGTGRFVARWHAGSSDLGISVRYTGVGVRGANYRLPFAPVGSREIWDVGVSITHWPGSI